MLFTLDCNEKYMFWKRDWLSGMRKAEGLKTEVASRKYWSTKKTLKANYQARIRTHSLASHPTIIQILPYCLYNNNVVSIL